MVGGNNFEGVVMRRYVAAAGGIHRLPEFWRVGVLALSCIHLFLRYGSRF